MYMATTNTSGAASIAFCLTGSDRLVVASSVTRGLRSGPAAEHHAFCFCLGRPGRTKSCFGRQERARDFRRRRRVRILSGNLFAGRYQDTRLDANN